MYIHMCIYRPLGAQPYQTPQQRVYAVHEPVETDKHRDISSACI